MIHATIDGKAVCVPEGSTILEAAQSVGVNIPTLCWLKNVTPEASCRMCMVEIKGMPKLVTACSYPIAEGYDILTRSERVIEARRSILDLLLSNHPTNCFSCPGNGDCKLQNYCYEYGVEKTSYPGEMIEKPIDDSNPYFTYNPNLCILCHRCVNVCNKIVKRGAISTINRGFKAMVSTPFGQSWIDTKDCEFCGNCVQACPVGALRTKNRYSLYRPWQVQKVLATCYNCKNGNGCKRYLLVRDGKVVDVVSKTDEPNNGRICNKGRFEFYDVTRPEQVDRLQQEDIEKLRASMVEALKLEEIGKDAVIANDAF